MDSASNKATAPVATAASAAAAAVPVTAPAVAAAAVPQKIRHEWYQTDSHVVVTVFCKNLTRDAVALDLQPSSLSLTLRLDAGREWALDLARLAGEVVPAESRFDVLSTKVEVWLKKRYNARWPALEGQPGAEDAPAPALVVPPPAATAASATGGVVAPYASKKKVQDWDKYVADQKDLDDDDPLVSAVLVCS